MAESKKPSAPGLHALRPSSAPPPSLNLADIARETTQTRRILELLIVSVQEDRERQAQRHEALLGMLGDILVKLP